MSEYGFEIKNAYGQTVADCNYPVYTVVGSGAVTLGGYDIHSSCRLGAGVICRGTVGTTAIIPVNIDISYMPMVFFQLPTTSNGNPTIAVLGYMMSGTVITGLKVHSSWVNVFLSSTYVVNYVVAVPVSYLGNPGGYGLAAYDANGKCTFHTGQRLLTVKQVGYVPHGGTLSHPTIYGNRYVAIGGLTAIIIYKYQLIGGYYFSNTFSVGGVYNYSPNAVGLGADVLYYDFNPSDIAQGFGSTIIVAELGA